MLPGTGRAQQFQAAAVPQRLPYFYAFDILAVNGRNVHALPLLERKRLLVNVLPKIESRIVYLDHIVERGVDFYELACRRDLEGIVTKWAHGTYQTDRRSTSWMKSKNGVLADARTARTVRGPP